MKTSQKIKKTIILIFMLKCNYGIMKNSNIAILQIKDGLTEALY